MLVYGKYVCFDMSWSPNCIVGSHECLHPVAVSAFMICRGLCACTEMLWMCVLYVSFGSKVRPRTFGCVAMGSALSCILGPDSSCILSRTESKLFCLDIV